MTRALAFFFVASALLPAQVTLTTVADTIRDAKGSLVTGDCTFAAYKRFTAGGGYQVVGEPVKIKFTNGDFTVDLVPTDTGLPATQYYTVTCTGYRGWKWTGRALVPTSTDPLTWADVMVADAPPPSVAVTLPQITVPSAAVEGSTYCLKVLNGIFTIVACTGGGSTTPTWTTMTNAQWTALTNSQWTALTN